ncbi:MAG: purine-nucleoside phosphorylase, partial [Clostridia bacterium]|nr:purine-nucleoside phosphorylase [Clostridia bacterium]
MEEKRIAAAADAIRSACGDAEIGLILGSGLADSIAPLAGEHVLPYDSIPGFPLSTVPGHKSEWVSGMLQGKRVCIMRGRFHYYEGYDVRDLTLPVRVMKRL